MLLIKSKTKGKKDEVCIKTQMERAIKFMW